MMNNWKKLNLRNVSADTWARLVILILALVCATILLFRDGVDFEATVTSVLTAGSALWGFWKNNNFTLGAQTAQEALDNLKNEEE